MPDGGASEIPLMLGLIGSSAVSGALAPSPQVRQSFAGSAEDPHNILGGVLAQNAALTNRIGGENFSLPDAFVQGVPSFAGGGLPMPIGVTGHDPMASNPAGLTTQHVGGAGPMAPGVTPRFSGPVPPNDNTGNAAIDPTGPGATGGLNSGNVHRVSSSVQRMPASGDDYTQALSALKLLRGA